MRLFAVLLTIMICTASAVSVQADEPVRDVSVEQRQLAERIASRMTILLEGEPYAVEQTCTASDDCTISIYR